ncbi:hypothetical protein M406DRAFT_320649 [Cryphonectria parasitica EP155]|uniref:Thioredoxin-like fold domain-containing protein n=1 Tax=Cryphonectria parasitica (strain ATCC 38755 / EP155) TaxID=660469 RepID=A0A9P4YDX4_CRYP1|nr:uncharacterized protein M406DRAFT_320649 [Cryphonectria parasitica EP155]KAF3771134.1 hypothetical protein M406DRAFT_320649 [Cryphonectria parasitica EP155]
MSDPENTSTLTLFRGWPTRGEHVWSPFVVKLEARLRFAGMTYEAGAGSPRSAPKGKIPYITIRPPGKAELVQMGDSTLIIQQLVRWEVVPDLNASLSAEDRAQDLATRALLEDKLYFYHTRERWFDNYYAMRDHALSAIPWPARVLVGLLAYRSHKATLYGQGTLRLSDEEVRASKKEIWETISGVLSSSAARARNTRTSKAAGAEEPFWFLGGHEPTEVDATLFGFIVSVLLCTAGPESREIVGQYPVLAEYAERIHATYFPDYSKWC